MTYYTYNYGHYTFIRDRTRVSLKNNLYKQVCNTFNHTIILYYQINLGITYMYRETIIIKKMFAKIKRRAISIHTKTEF